MSDQPKGKNLKFCSDCQTRHLWPDDPHGLCFKCRGGPFHKCSVCDLMGPESVKVWATFVANKSKDKPPMLNQSEDSTTLGRGQYNDQGPNRGGGHTVSQAPPGGRGALSDPAQEGGDRSNPSSGAPPGDAQTGRQNFVSVEQFSSLVASLQALQNTVSALAPVSVQSPPPPPPPPPPHPRQSATLTTSSGSVGPGLGVRDTPGFSTSGSVVGIDLHAEGSLGDDSDHESTRSRTSALNYKRYRSEDVDAEDSVSQTGSDKTVTEGKVDESYVDLVADMVKFLKIEGADIGEAEQADILSSRVKDKKVKVSLPLAKSHKNVLDRIWEKPISNMSTFRQSVTERYHVAEEDTEQYLKISAHDKLLSHALRRQGVPFKAPKKKSEPIPELPNKLHKKVEARAWAIERQALLGMACASSQSWIIQYISKKLQVLDECLRDTCPGQYDDIVAQTGCDQLGKAVLIAQDAAIDELDLFGRMAANAKHQRRVLWLEPTKWNRDLQDRVLKFPFVSGQLFGDKLYDTVNEYKEFDEALMHADPAIQGKSGSDRVKFVKNTVASLAPGTKRQKTSETTWRGKPSRSDSGDRKRKAPHQDDRKGGDSQFRRPDRKDNKWAGKWNQNKGSTGSKNFNRSNTWTDQSGKGSR